MKITAIVLSLGAVVLAACGGGDKAKMTKLKESMCACKDAACADQVMKDTEAFEKSVADKYKDEKDVPKELIALADDLDKCEKSARLGEDGAKLSAMRDKMCQCKDAACVDKVNKDNADFFKAMGDKYKDANDIPKNLMSIAMEMSECASKAMGGDVAPPAPPPAAGSGAAPTATGIPACDAYLAAEAKYIACDKVSATDKEWPKQANGKMIESVIELGKHDNVSPDLKAAASDSCKAALDTLGQLSSAAGCAP